MLIGIDALGIYPSFRIPMHNVFAARMPGDRMDLDLRDKPAGYYLVRLTLGHKTVQQLVIIQ